MPSGVLTDQQQILTFGGAFVLGITIGRLIGRLRQGGKEPRVHGPAAQNSKFLAAWRAVESLELEGKLFSDELSVILAGQKQFAVALAAAKPYQPLALDGLPGRRLYRISQIAARTWWMDRSIMTALTSPAIPATKGWLSARLTSSARGPSAPPHQLVILGAGMDSRAWRLPLPPALKWFEIDRPEVLSAKRRALSGAGAEIPSEGGVPQHPLRAASWAAVPMDLSKDANILEALLAQGFDLEEPTVWVLEGILMFLSDDAVDRLFAQLSEASAPGSSVIVHALTDEVVEKLTACPGGETVPGLSFFPPSVVKCWKSGLPVDPSSVLDKAGLRVESVSTLAEIAQQICGGDTGGKCDFNVQIKSEEDRNEVFFVAKKPT